MALITCPECGNKVSDKSKMCVHCGYPLENYQFSQKIVCPRCNNENDPDSSFCTECGSPLTSVAVKQPTKQIKQTVICPFCGFGNEPGSIFCTNCGKSIDINMINTAIQKRQLEIMESEARARKAQEKANRAEQLERQKTMELEQKVLKAQARDMKKMARCPRCSSTSLSSNKKGYGIGKGLIGAAIAGPIGLVAGNIGSGKVTVTCLKCGYRFKP